MVLPEVAFVQGIEGGKGMSRASRVGEDIGSRNRFGERPEEGSMPWVFEDTVRSGWRAVGRRESNSGRTEGTSGT